MCGNKSSSVHVLYEILFVVRNKKHKENALCDVNST